MIVVDTGALYAFFVRDDLQHQDAAPALTSRDELLIVSPRISEWG